MSQNEEEFGRWAEGWAMVAVGDCAEAANADCHILRALIPTGLSTVRCGRHATAFRGISSSTHQDCDHRTDLYV